MSRPKSHSSKGSGSKNADALDLIINGSTLPVISEQCTCNPPEDFECDRCKSLKLAAAQQPPTPSHSSKGSGSYASEIRKQRKVHREERRNRPDPAAVAAQQATKLYVQRNWTPEPAAQQQPASPAPAKDTDGARLSVVKRMYEIACNDRDAATAELERVKAQRDRLLAALKRAVVAIEGFVPSSGSAEADVEARAAIAAAERNK